jgi:hypothetical protein
MSTVLADDKHHQIVALGRLGWSPRRIERTTGVRRETISGYLKAVGIVVPGRGRRRASRAKPPISMASVSKVARNWRPFRWLGDGQHCGQIADVDSPASDHVGLTSTNAS